MARDLGPSCRKCRREGEKLFLKGQRCSSAKCSMNNRDYAPGQQTGRRSGKLSNYGLQLREKQKVKRIYGVLERQFRIYFEKASRAKGITGAMLLKFLERRLDNVIYQAGFASSRKEARQIVSHRFINVNGRTVNIPSFLVSLNDEISFKLRGKTTDKFIKWNIEETKGRVIPAWLAVDQKQLKINVVKMPEREDIQFPVNEQLIVELYSR